MKTEPTTECQFCFGGGCEVCGQSGQMTPQQETEACARLAKALSRFREDRLREMAAKCEMAAKKTEADLQKAA